MVAQVRDSGFHEVDHTAIFNDMRHWDTAVELIRPQGGIVLIDDTNLPMPMAGMKMKAASLHWEFMFARAMHQTSDMVEQHNLLSYVANEIDAGRIRTTLSEVLTPINAENIRIAHALLETGQAKGKIVVHNSEIYTNRLWIGKQFIAGSYTGVPRTIAPDRFADLDTEIKN